MSPRGLVVSDSAAAETRPKAEVLKDVGEYVSALLAALSEDGLPSPSTKK